MHVSFSLDLSMIDNFFGFSIQCLMRRLVSQMWQRTSGCLTILLDASYLALSVHLILYQFRLSDVIIWIILFHILI